VAQARDPVVEPVGERPGDDRPERGHDRPQSPDLAHAAENSLGPHPQAAVRRAEDEAVGERAAPFLGDEGPEGLPSERGEAEGSTAVDREEETDREVAERAAAVVEEDGGRQGCSASRAATRASMLATEVRPSRRKRTTAEPSSPGLRASRISLVGKAASSSVSTSASPQ